MIIINKILITLALISLFFSSVQSKNNINQLYNSEFNHLDIISAIQCENLIKSSKISLLNTDNISKENDIIWFNSHMHKFRSICNDYIMWKAIDRALNGEELTLKGVIDK